jgi:hypothetical protein
MGFPGKVLGGAADPVAPSRRPIHLPTLGPWHGSPVVAEAIQLALRIDVHAKLTSGVGEAGLVRPPAVWQPRSPRLGPPGGCQTDRFDWGIPFRTK